MIQGNLVGSPKDSSEQEADYPHYNNKSEILVKDEMHYASNSGTNEEPSEYSGNKISTASHKYNE